MDRILDSKLYKKKGLQYRVRWVGWDNSYDTWEPRSGLANVAEKIAQFHEANPTKPGQPGVEKYG